MFNSQKYVSTLIAESDKYKSKRLIFDELYDKLKQTNISLIGLPKTGKTVLIKQLANKYIEEFKIHKDSIFYTNMKSLWMKDNQTKWTELFNEISNNDYKLVIIDEIQEIDGWTRLLQAIIDLKQSSCRFIVASSNNIAFCHTLLPGKMCHFFITPLLYNEFIQLWSLPDNEESINEYLMFGSYPKSCNYIYPEIQYKETINSNIINSLIVEDLKDKVIISKFKSFLEELNCYIGLELNAKAIEQKINVVRQTVPEYINSMIDTRLVYSINRYKYTGKLKKKKVYYADKSLIYWFDEMAGISSKIIENVVFNYLAFHYLNKISLTEITYYKNKDNKEINFVIEREKLLVVVNYENNLDPSKLSSVLNDTIKSESQFNKFKKVVITKYLDCDSVNDWCFISINNYLRCNGTLK